MSPRVNWVNWDVTYPVSRPYPSKWLKWFLVILFPLLFVLFSIINIATTGSSLRPTYSSDPNKTESERKWFHNPLFTLGDDKLDPKCQAYDLAIGNEFTTSNSGLLYKVREVTDANGVRRGSLAYTNNILRDCQINKVEIQMARNDQGPGGELKYFRWKGATATARAQCQVTNPNGTFTLNFETVYDTPGLDVSYILNRNASTRASFWWGSLLLNNHFTGLKALLAHARPNSGGPDGNISYTHATITYDAIANASLGSISNFNTDGIFKYPPGYILTRSDGEIHTAENGEGAADVYNNATSERSPPLTEGLTFAKILYSLILVDLGSTIQQNAAATNGGSISPNLLLDAEHLREVLKGSGMLHRESGTGILFNSTALEDDDSIDARDWWRWRGIPRPDQDWTRENAADGLVLPMEESYESSSVQNQLGALDNPALRGARINAQYLCNVPQRNGLPSIILLTVLASFVLLQTSWIVIKFFLGLWVERADERAMWCEGCVAHYHARTMEEGKMNATVSALPSQVELGPPRSQPLRGTTSSRASLTYPPMGVYHVIPGATRSSIDSSRLSLDGTDVVSVRSSASTASVSSPRLQMLERDATSTQASNDRSARAATSPYPQI